MRNLAVLSRETLLQKALDRERAKSAILRHILGSPDLPIVSLGPRLTLRFFTAEAGTLLGISQNNIGAALPCAALIGPQGALLARIRSVLHSGIPDALEIEVASKQRFLCRILPLVSDQTEAPDIDGVTLAFMAARPAALLVPAAPAPKAAEGRGNSARYPELGCNLTRRQHQILGHVLAGHPSKNIAADLGICRRTVENHRAAIMQRTGVTSLPALTRLAIGADVGGDCKIVPGF